MLCLNISDITVFTSNGADYCCFPHDIRKSGTIHLLEHSGRDDRGYILNKFQRN